ncbi:hypothetical protein HK104_001379 [Borealophlyctis nickersoniae]|nr:hypothetical protein HK104_001379 [Borealophlyctis nickersoniae]
MALNFRAFCRRMVVIAAEDVFLDPGCFTLIWMFKMSKLEAFQPTKRIVDHLLGYVKALCEEKRYVKYGKEDTFTVEQPNGFQELLQMFVYEAMLMNGDEKMLKWYYNHMTSISVSDMRLFAWEPVDESEVPYMTWDELPLEGIDFHTHKYLLGMIHSRNPVIPQERIQTVIWKARSSINHRKQPSPPKIDLHPSTQQIPLPAHVLMTG